MPVTKKMMDLYIERTIRKRCSTPTEAMREVFIAGLRAAAKIIRNTLADDGWAGTERQERMILDAAKRLAKELK